MYDNILPELIKRKDNAALTEYVIDLVRRHAPEAKIFPTLAENGETSLLIMRGAPQTLFVAHTDVVPADSAEWKTDPFLLRETQRKLIGRGVVDNKTHVSLLLELLFSLKDTPIALALTTGEETRLWGARSLEIPSGVTQVVVLEPTSGQVITQHLGTSGYELVFRSRGGHSSEKNVDHPILRAGKWVTSFPVPEDAVINIGSIKGGNKLNVIPEQCAVGVNYRYLTTPPEEWETLLRDHTYIDDMIELFHFPPFRSTANETFLKTLASLGISVASQPARFYSEAAIFEQRGYPTLLWGIGNIEQAHTINEYIEKESVVFGRNILTTLIAALG